MSYGLGWSLEMPPVEKGQTDCARGSSNDVISALDYLNTRKADALKGQVYNPEIGFSLVHNAAGHPKYPYNPFYKSFSPRIAVAWNPHFDSGFMDTLFGENKTVIRGGYSILYGRLNGVGLVLVPLLGYGLIQPVRCLDPLADGSCGGGSGTPATPSASGQPPAVGTAWSRPLPNGTPTLPQPVFPASTASRLPPVKSSIQISGPA